MYYSKIYIFFIPLLFRQDNGEMTGKYWVERGGNIGIGPQNWNWICSCAVYVGALTTRLYTHTHTHTHTHIHIYFKQEQAWLNTCLHDYIKFHSCIIICLFFFLIWSIGVFISEQTWSSLLVWLRLNFCWHSLVSERELCWLFFLNYALHTKVQFGNPALLTELLVLFGTAEVLA